ncbi:MAG: DUF58 domain-containing protein [Bryobacteraceae bacterium]|nr:DUF58 domain-containing protein [Bryobacteraceae bacterium]
MPRTRLLLVFALVALPAAALLSQYVILGAALLTLLVATLALDAVLGSGILRGLRAELDPLTRLALERPGEVAIRFENPAQRGLTIRAGLPLPRELEHDSVEIQAQLPAGATWSRVTLPVLPTRRGDFPLVDCFVEAASPLGLWSHRRRLSATGRIRVYPNLMAERAALAALSRQMAGPRQPRQIGKGREFEKLREYLPGDGFDEIDWKATARRGKPVTRVFRVERTQEIYVLIDAARLSGRLVGGQTVLERYLTAALILGDTAQREGDRFGLVTYSDEVHRFLRASSGAPHFGLCRDSLVNLQTQLVNPDFDELFTQIRTRLRRRAMLVFLTALDDPILAESFARHARLLARQHLVCVNLLQPESMRPLFTGPPPEKTDEIYDRLGSHLSWQKLMECGRGLRQEGIQFSLLDPQRFTYEVIEQYRTLKQRQLL